MKRYVVRRICTGILTVLIAFALNFALMKMAPGDPITTLMGKDNDSPEMRQALEEKYGLNEPIPVQFTSYLKTALQGDLGNPMCLTQCLTSGWG